MIFGVSGRVMITHHVRLEHEVVQSSDTLLFIFSSSKSRCSDFIGCNHLEMIAALPNS